MNFNPDKALKNQNLDSRIIDIFKIEANSFLEELKIRKLEVILTPAPDPHHEGHKIRTVVNENPEWYKNLYWKYYPNFRRDRTSNALKRLINLEDKNFMKSKYKYDAVIRELIYTILIEGYHIHGHKIYPENNIVKKYFKE
jgi:hypothetical protein